MAHSDTLERPVSEPMLSVKGVSKHFAVRGWKKKVLRALDGVSFEVKAGECLAIVGESGSGKSTLARTLLRLIEPTTGVIRFQGTDLTSLSRRQMRRKRRNIQMIFQDPYASLHPNQRVSEIISEPWKVHKDVVARVDRPARIRELLQQVGLPEGYASVYPSRLSGGEKQRVAIARALALKPELLVLDEPVSALDVSIQAQVIQLLMRLQRDLGIAFVFISHDLALVRLVADRVAVMYLGKIVEVSDVGDLYDHPEHPYTQALLEAAPSLGALGEVDLQAFSNADSASPLDEAGGCAFRGRCWKAQDRCRTETPELEGHVPGSPMHLSACHFTEVTRSETVTLPSPTVRENNVEGDRP